MKDRGHNSISSRTFSVDELHRNNKQFQNTQSHQRTRFSCFLRVITNFISTLVSPSTVTTPTHRCQQFTDSTTSNPPFDRLSSTPINYSHSKKNSHRQNSRKQFEQQICPTLSHHSGGGDSGYSEESFAGKPFKRAIHTSCPHCHCEQRSSFNNYKKLKNNSSTESSPSDTINTCNIKKSSDIDYCNKENLLSSQSYPHIRTMPRVNFQSQQRITRTLADKRRRNLSCDGSLWMKTQTQKPTTSVRDMNGYM